MIFTLTQYDVTRLWLQFEIGLSGPVFNQVSEFCRQFKERVWRKEPNNGPCGWVIPCNVETIKHINSHYIEGQDFTITDTARAMLTYLILSTKLDERRAEKRWDYIFEGKETDFNYPSVVPPMSHQKVAVEAMVDYEYFALLMEMGTGKTKCIIDEVDHYARNVQEADQRRILVICPKSVRVNWLREFEKFMNPYVNYFAKIIDGADACEALVELMQSSAKIKVAIASYDSVRCSLAPFALFQPTYLCLDEAHYVKNHSTKRFKAIKEIARMDSCRQRRILTGTPVVNNLLDLWAQFEILQPGILGYNTYAGFKREFCNVVPVLSAQGQEFEKITSFKNVEVLKESMARVSFIVKKEKCLKDLPEKLYDTRRVEMPPSLRKKYDEFENNFCLALQEKVSVETDFIVVQMVKLAQMCCGYVVAKDKRGEKIEDIVVPIEGGDAKLNEMLDDIEEIYATSKLVVWARFHYDIDAITNALNSRNIGAVSYDGRTPDKHRQLFIDRFNGDPGTRVFVAHAGSGGVGLNLLGNQEIDSDRCKAAFFYSSDFSYGRREQAEARNHRKGQRSAVLYRDYVYENTIEETIASALQQKRDLAETMKDIGSIRELLQRNK